MTLQAESKSLDNNTETLLERIDLVTKYQKPYIANSLKRMAKKSACNVKVICEYIIAEQNAINIKESTKEGKIKCLVRFSTYLSSSTATSNGTLFFRKALMLWPLYFYRLVGFVNLQ